MLCPEPPAIYILVQWLIWGLLEPHYIRISFSDHIIVSLCFYEVGHHFIVRCAGFSRLRYFSIDSTMLQLYTTTASVFIQKQRNRLATSSYILFVSHSKLSEERKCRMEKSPNGSKPLILKRTWRKFAYLGHYWALDLRTNPRPSARGTNKCQGFSVRTIHSDKDL